MRALCSEKQDCSHNVAQKVNPRGPKIMKSKILSGIENLKNEVLFRKRVEYWFESTVSQERTRGEFCDKEFALAHKY